MATPPTIPPAIAPARARLDTAFVTGRETDDDVGSTSELLLVAITDDPDGVEVAGAVEDGEGDPDRQDVFVPLTIENTVDSAAMFGPVARKTYRPAVRLTGDHENVSEAASTSCPITTPMVEMSISPGLGSTVEETRSVMLQSAPM